MQAGVSQSPSSEGGDIGKTGQAVLTALTRAAHEAQRREQLAKAGLKRLEVSLWNATERLAALELRLAEAEQRAIEAETWLLHVGQAAKATFADPVMARSREYDLQQQAAE